MVSVAVIFLTARNRQSVMLEYSVKTVLFANDLKVTF